MGHGHIRKQCLDDKTEMLRIDSFRLEAYRLASLSEKGFYVCVLVYLRVSCHSLEHGLSSL